MKYSLAILLTAIFTLTGCATPPQAKKESAATCKIQFPGSVPTDAIDAVPQADGSVCFTPLLTKTRVCIKSPNYLLVCE